MRAAPVAFGGVMAALALVMMFLGGLIPVMTYVCPMLCLLVLAIVRQTCGNSIAWAWYAAVAFLALLMAPDREAAVLFVFLGYYPIVKPRLDGLRPKFLIWPIKIMLLSLSVGAAYALLIWILGMGELLAEFQGVGIVMGILMLVMGLFCLIGLDLVLSRLQHRKR